MSPSPSTDASPDTDQLILDHLPLARRLAHHYRDRGEPLDDLVQVAYLALVKAGRRYEQARGQSFAAYAAPTIVGELRRHFRDHGWDVRPPRRVQELHARVRYTENELTQALGRHPTTAELADELGVGEAEMRAAMTASHGYTATSFDDIERIDREELADRDADGFEEVLRILTLRPLLATLPARDRRIIALRFFGDATQAEIGRQIGVTQMQVSRLLRRAVGRMRVAAQEAA